ncbi:hypothetical protein DIPPA_16071 [Diplonema papillatum]|nr:hypothetical protein DIPPA_16071 [Diplonema papillatum]
MAIRVSITVVIVITMVLSTIASIGGGLLLYFEGLNILRERVHKLSTSETYSVVTSIETQLDETIDSARDLLQQITMHRDLLPTLEANRRWARATCYASMRARRNFYSMGMTAYPANMSAFDASSDDYLYEFSWGDLLENGSRQFVLGTSDASVTGCNLPTNASRCAAVYTINDDATQKHLQYKYSTGMPRRWAVNRAEEFRVRNNLSAADTVTFWEGPYTWISSDQFQYAYAGYSKVLSPGTLGGNPFFRDKRVSLQTYIQFEQWSEFLAAHTTDAQMVILHYNSVVSSSVVLATNGRRRWQNCSDKMLTRNLSLVCPTMVGDLSQDIVAVLAAVTEEHLYDTFSRVSAPEGDVWVLAVEVAAQITRDTGGKYVLLWVLPVSAVEAEMRESLFGGVLFMGCVLVVIYGFGLVQSRLLARPLKDLARATEALQKVDLNLTEACTADAERGFLRMKEVVAVTDGLRFVIRSLRIVKMFLPQYALVGNSPDRKSSLGDNERFAAWKVSDESINLPQSPDDNMADNEGKPTVIQPFTADAASSVSNQPADTDSSTPYNSTASPAASPSRPNHVVKTSNPLHPLSTTHTTVGGKTLNVLDNVKATILTFQLQETEDFSTFEKILSQFEHAASSSNGLLHPLSATSPFRLTISWNTSNPCVGGVNRACTVSRGLSEYLSHRLLSCAIAHGPCSAGFVGTRRTLAFAICGTPVDLSDALLLSSAEFSPLLNSPVIAICAASQASIRGTFRVAPIDIVSVKSSVSTVWMLGSRDDEKNVEWMYQPNSSHSLEPLFTRLVRGTGSLPGDGAVRDPAFDEPHDDEVAQIVVRRLKARYPAVLGFVPDQLLRCSNNHVRPDGHDALIESNL